MNIELASDSKDFSNMLAKTRLAEMTNPKIVPIPQPKQPATLPPPLQQSTGKDFEGRLLSILPLKVLAMTIDALGHF